MEKGRGDEGRGIEYLVVVNVVIPTKTHFAGIIFIF